MTAYVLDSSALIRYVDNEAGSDRIEAILRDCVAGRSKVSVSAVQWGEVAGNLRKRMGAAHQERILSTLLPVEAEISAATADRAVGAAVLKIDRNLSYADAFALELTMDSPDRVLVTADYDFKSVDDLARIEFLPAK
jgi:predicted nucleic acid-binding protein